MAQYDDAFVAIEYDEPDPTTYRAVRVVLRKNGQKEERRYATGNPVVDWAAARDEVSTLVELVAFSSTVDQFQMDGGVLEADDAEGAAPADPVFELVRATVLELARRDELDVPCTCDECLAELTEELYERVTPYKRVMTA